MENEKPTSAERSLLDEIEELQVLEAEELQEGVAFHAFKFSANSALDSMILTLEGDATALVRKLEMPQGATIMDVQGKRVRILFDAAAVKPASLKASLTKALGRSLVGAEHDKVNKVALTELRGTKLG